MLTAADLDIGYRTNKGVNKILGELSLCLTKQSLICLVGINGSGKSTLLRTLARMQKALAGTITLDNRGIDTFSAKELAQNISVVLTHNEIAGKMTVREVVALGRYPYTNWLATLSESDEQIINRALDLVGLTQYSKSYYEELSDGQRQKVIIGRAVAQDTPIIILDEPTNHLDIGNKAEIFQLLQNLAHIEGKSVLVSTHDLSFARQSADELWVLSNGKLVCGSPEKLEILGSLRDAFPYKGIDLISGKFIRDPIKGAVSLLGKGKMADVTRSALVRIGFSVEHDSSTKISVEELSGHWVWKLSDSGKSDSFTDIDELISALKKL